MLKLIVLLCVVGTALAGTTRNAIPRLDGRIVGGSSTSIDNYPYQVSVQAFGMHYCGGSILNDQWVLTAAHCMTYVSGYYSVRAGTSTRESGGTMYSVSSVVRHSNYSSSTYDYDIAVVKISGSFSFDTDVQPIDLASSIPASGAVAVVTGWGSTSEGGSSPSTLQYVEVPIVSNSECNIFYSTWSITDRMLCAGYVSGGKDACQGDSGGPLVSGGVQVGVVSFGLGCARPNYPGVYTNVANLRSWILSNTGI